MFLSHPLSNLLNVNESSDLWELVALFKHSLYSAILCKINYPEENFIDFDRAYPFHRDLRCTNSARHPMAQLNNRGPYVFILTAPSRPWLTMQSLDITRKKQ